MAKLKLTCPPTQQATSLDGEPVAVSWPDARTIGGQAPVVVLYGVKSGSKFPVGTVNVSVKAKSADNQSSHCSFSITVTAADQPPEVVPLPPTQLVGAVTGPSQIDLSWQEKPGKKTGFPIERKVSGAPFQEIDVAPPTSPTYQDTSVDTQTTGYDYRVRARNTTGDSPYSNIVTVGPSAPPLPVGAWVSTDGVDVANSGAYLSPWATIGYALTQQASWPSRRLNVFGNGRVYTDPIEPSISGASGNPYIIAGYYTTTRPIIRASNIRQLHTNGLSWINVSGFDCDAINAIDWDVAKLEMTGGGIRSTDITLDDCQFYNGRNPSGNPGGQGLLLGGCQHITIRNCRAFNNGRTNNKIHGFYISESSDVTFIDCDAYANGCVGFHAYAIVANSNANLTFLRCKAYGNGVAATGTGFLFGAGGGQAARNCIAWGQHRGFEVDSFGGALANGVKMYHCVAWNHSEYGYRIITGSGHERKNCIAYQNATNVTDGTGSLTAGNLEDGTDPDFSDPSHGDFRINTTSAAKNIGVVTDVLRDFYGNGRIGNPDAGIHEVG